MNRLVVALLLAAAFASPAFSQVAEAQKSSLPPPTKPVMLIVHGAWGGAWQFAKVDPLLREQGFDVRRPTLTGLGERVHLASADIGLQTHIEDIVNVFLFENLRDVILVGHSYGGMVITGVADRIPDRIKQLVYLDAMLPNSGESVVDLGSAGIELEKMKRDGFLIPGWVRPGKPHPIDVPHPYKTVTDKLDLKNPAREAIPAVYILTVDAGKAPESDGFARYAERARQRGWRVVTMEADHNPQWRLPVETAKLLGSLR